MKSKENGFLSQFVTLFKRDIELLLGDKVKLLVTMLLPVAIGLVITAVVKKGEVGEVFETTKSTLFTIISAAIYTGMFNSLTLICKERSIIKREYMTGMKLSSFIYSNVALQSIVCAIQTIIFMIIYWFYPSLGLDPNGHVFMGNAFMEYTIGLFLIMMASDMMGMFISSIVRSNEIANLTAPVIIIVQLVMSGVLFELKGMMNKIASITVSKWGMEALGRVANLADLTSKIRDKAPDKPKVPKLFREIPNVKKPGEFINGTKPFRKAINKVVDEIAEESKGAVDIYDAEKMELVKDWLILFAFIIVLSILCIIVLKRVSKDQR